MKTLCDTTMYIIGKIIILCDAGDVLAKSAESRPCDQGIEGSDFGPGTATE